MNKLLSSVLFIVLSIFGYSQSKITIDSLAGFDFAGALEHASHAKTAQQRMEMMAHAKRSYIDMKFDLYNQSKRSNPNNESFNEGQTNYLNYLTNNANNKGTVGNTYQGPQPAGCNNVDFEANNTSGWTVTGDFAVTSGAGLDPFGNFPVVFPGGLHSLQLNNNNTSCTGPNAKVNFGASCTRTIAVTPANNQFQFHFAVVILNFPHPAFAAANFQVNFYDQNNNKIACPTYSCYYASPPNAFVGLPPGIAQTAAGTGWQICNAGSYPVTYVPWQTVGSDLSTYNGQNVKLVITCNWCLYNYDWAYCYIDADCGAALPTTPIVSCEGVLHGPPGVATYTWTPPVGPVVNTPTLMATTPGTYICATTGFITCQAGVTYTYIVNPAPTPSFVANTSCLGAANSFTNLSTLNGGPPITNVVWQWGDGTPNTAGPNANLPNHTYTATGTHTVQLVVTNSNGCTDSISQQVVVNGKPVANFQFNTICQGAPTNFTNTTNANGNVMSNWYWDFNNDGIPDNLTQNPSYTFVNSGNYVVGLIGVTNLGCADSIQQTVSVYSKPVAKFGYTKTCFGDFTYFGDASYVVGTNGQLNSWAWDLDNNIATIEDTHQNAMTVFNTYGPHTVHLIVTTTFGCSDTAALNMYVNVYPTVDFVADKTQGCSKLPVKFTNNSSILVGSITSYSWNVGDNGTSTDTNTTHIYPVGNYTVTLWATSDSGCTAKKVINNYIHSWPSPMANYEVSPQTTDILEPYVNFTNTTLDYSKFWWYFGDTPYCDSTTHDPTHVYNGDYANQYMTTLIVANSYGCTDTTQRLVVVNPSYVIYLPNAFTPNGDGLNDVFQAKGYYISKFDMQIYDRWGEQIFTTNDIAKGWDGTIKGKVAENSVYVWKAIVIDVQHKRHMLTGHVTLIK